jgi:hypothetical protein
LHVPELAEAVIQKKNDLFEAWNHLPSAHMNKTNARVFCGKQEGDEVSLNLSQLLLSSNLDLYHRGIESIAISSKKMLRRC